MRDIQLKPNDILDRDMLFQNINRNIKEYARIYPNIFNNLDALFVVVDELIEERGVSELTREDIIRVTTCATIEMMLMANPPECLASIFGDTENV